MFAAKHGKRGVEFQQVFAEIEGSHEALARLQALTSVKSQPGVRAKNRAQWFEPARSLLSKKKILFDRGEYFSKDFPMDFQNKVFEMVGQVLQSHIGLVETWKKEKKVWEEEKTAWQETNAPYFAVKSLFDQFAEEQGTLRLSRERWHKYYEFLAVHGKQLMTWQKKNTLFTPSNRNLSRSTKMTRINLLISFSNKIQN